ncbi:hypothetical protein RAO22_06720 [Pediococcus acidilactici]
MRKKTMLTTLIALGFITPIITNTGASAAEFSKNAPPNTEIIQKINQHQQKLPKLTENQLKIQNSDIETWMSNPTVREILLSFLIQRGYLEEGSTVNEITKDLLGSIKAGEVINFNINTFAGAQITPNLAKGLQYINPQVSVGMELIDADDTQLMQVDFSQLHQNVDRWNVYIVNPNKIGNSQVAQRVIDAKLPKKIAQPESPEIYYIRGTFTDDGSTLVPKSTFSVDISETLFPTIKVSDADFWKDVDTSKFSESHRVASALIRKKDFFNLLRPGSFYMFEKDSEGNFLGTLSETPITKEAMNKVAENPQDYYAWLISTYIYNDGQHQSFTLASTVYGDYHK